MRTATPNKNFLNSLPILAGIIGNKFGVTIHFGDGVYTDGNCITLPANPKQPLTKDELTAFILHEGGHVRLTDFRVHSSRPRLDNALEDPRIEAEMIRLYPGGLAFLKKCHEPRIAEFGDFGEFDGISLIEMYCLLKANLFAQPWMGKFHTKARARAVALFGDELMGKLDQLIEKEFPKCMSTLDITKLSEEILNLLRKYKPPELESEDEPNGESDDQGDGEGQDQDQQGQGQGSGQGQDQDQSQQGEETEASQDAEDSESGSQSQSQSGSESESESQSQDGDDDGQGQDQGQQGQGEEESNSSESNSGSGSDSGSGLEGSQDSQNQPQGSGFGGSNSSGSPQAGKFNPFWDEDVSGQQPYDFGQQITEKIGERLDRCSYTDEDVVSKPYHAPNQAPSKRRPWEQKNGMSLIRTAKAESAKLSKVMSGLVQTKTRSGQYASNSGRRLISSRLSRLPFGETKVFSKREDAKGIDTAVTILLDMSSSMHDGCADLQAIRAALTLMCGFRKIKEVKTSLKVFPGYMAVDTGRMPESGWSDQQQMSAISCCVEVVGFDDTLEHRAEIIGAIHSNGGTPLVGAMRQTAFELAQRRERRKIVIVITDGYIDDLAVQTVSSMRRSGVEMIGFSIGVPGNKKIENAFDAFECLYSAQGLKEALVKVASQTFLKGI